jgi:signal transduction histidine kinase
MRSELWNRAARWVTARPSRVTLLNYLISILAVVGTSWLLPANTLGDSRGIVPFLVIVACAWYGGLGPGLLSLVVLVLSFHFRTKGFPDCLVFSRQELVMVGVLGVVIGPVGWAGTLRRRSHEVAKRQDRELRDLHRRKDEFLATLAHELRNPMAPLRSGLEVLRLAAERPGARVDTGQIRLMMQRQVDHLVRLIDDLLEVSRINTGKIELRRMQVEIAEVIRDAIEASRPHITAAKHELSVVFPDSPIVVEVDLARLTQVLTNLLNNAAKFTAPGGHIALSASLDQHRVRIVVRDTGIGISPEMLPRVFDMFAQVPSHVERSQGGLGVGLSLARALTEQHGGMIEAFSEGPGKGSEFVVTLPESVVVRPVQNNARDVTVRQSAKELGRRILIVDDNADAALSLAMLLSANGYQCQPVNDALTALNAAPQINPDVFLLDIGMPGMNGYELAQRLRALPQFRNSLLIAVTGWGKEEDRQKSREAGFDYHLVKPVSVSAIHELIDKR